MTTTTKISHLSDTELEEIGEALWSLDTNNVFNFIQVNTQGTTGPNGRDNAPKRLLVVSPEAYERPTIKKLMALQDNYIAQVGKKEIVTPQETREENEFLDAILSTPIMKKTREFLREKGFIPTRGNKDSSTIFRDTLRQIWFGMYSRQNPTLGSSGFEHSFIGEIKNEKISGFHNWIYFARQEEYNKLDYNGHMKVLRLAQNGMVLKYNFDWSDKTKPVNTMFVGTSPEFEMAIYTICFYARPGSECQLKFCGKVVRINTHYFSRGDKRYVASAFPEI